MLLNALFHLYLYGIVALRNLRITLFSLFTGVKKIYFINHLLKYKSSECTWCNIVKNSTESYGIQRQILYRQQNITCSTFTLTPHHTSRAKARLFFSFLLFLLLLLIIPLQHTKQNGGENKSKSATTTTTENITVRGQRQWLSSYSNWNKHGINGRRWIKFNVWFNQSPSITTTCSGTV